MTRRDRIRRASSAPTRPPLGRLWDVFERRVVMPYVLLMSLWMLYKVITSNAWTVG